METAFIVTLDLDDVNSTELELVSGELLDAVESTGHLVLSVKPWQRPTLAAPNLTLPTISGLGQQDQTGTEQIP